MATPSQRVLQALPPGEPAYAVVDGARRHALGGQLSSHWLATCLYRGRLPAALAAAAPYLVRLWPGEAFTERFFALGWRDDWGLLLTCSAPRKELHRHLRRFLLARDQRGRRLLFRFYDPRVLGIWLPTCTTVEAAAFFGPVGAFALPGEAPGTVAVWRCGALGLERACVAESAAAAGALEGPRQPPAPAAPRRGAWQPLLVRDPQFEALEAAAEARFVEQLAAEVARRWPEPHARLGPDGVVSALRAAISRCRGYGLDDPEQVRAFAGMLFALGGGEFDRQPWARAVLEDAGLSGRLKIIELQDALAAQRAEREAERAEVEAEARQRSAAEAQGVGAPQAEGAAA